MKSQITGNEEKKKKKLCEEQKILRRLIKVFLLYFSI